MKRGYRKHEIYVIAVSMGQYLEDYSLISKFHICTFYPAKAMQFAGKLAADIALQKLINADIANEFWRIERYESNSSC